MACTELRAEGIAVIAPNRSFIETCLDKERLIECLYCRGPAGPAHGSGGGGRRRRRLSVCAEAA